MKSAAERDCFALIQQISLLQDPRCIVCGEPSSAGHHVFGRGLAVAFELEMVRGLCEKHHIPFAHKQPEAFKAFFMAFIGGPRHYERLKRKSREIIPYMDFEMKRVELRAILADLQKRAA